MATKQPLSPFGIMVTTLDALVTEAEAYKAASSDAPTAKVSKAARTLHNVLADAPTEANVPADLAGILSAWLDTLPRVGVFDRQAEMDSARQALQTTLMLPDALKAVIMGEGDSAGAQKLVDRALALRTGTRAPKGEGEHASPAEAYLEHYGIGKLAITVSLPDGVSAGKKPNSFKAGSTRSSLSNELTTRVKLIDDVKSNSADRYKAPEANRDAWRAIDAWVTDKDRETDGLSVTYTTTRGDMLVGVAITERV